MRYRVAQRQAAQRSGLTQVLGGKSEPTMNFEKKAILRRVAKTIFAAIIASYFIVVVFVMFGPLYVGGEFAIRQAGTFTAILTPFVCIPTFFFFLRRDRNRKSIGL